MEASPGAIVHLSTAWTILTDQGYGTLQPALHSLKKKKKIHLILIMCTWGQWCMLTSAGVCRGQKRKSDPSGTGVTGSPEATGLLQVQDQPGLPNKTLFQI